MKRGDIVIGGQHGAFTGKLHPYVVVQNAVSLDIHPTITACPLTTVITGAYLVRIAVPTAVETGLARVSEIEIDKVTTLRRSAIGETIGTMPGVLMIAVDTALRRWLDL